MKKIEEIIIGFFASLARPHPARDWFIVLTIASIAFFGSVLFAGYLLYGIRSGAVVEPVAVEAPAQPSITKADIQNILETYRTRRVNYEAHNFQAVPLTDPR